MVQYRLKATVKATAWHPDHPRAQDIVLASDPTTTHRGIVCSDGRTHCPKPGFEFMVIERPSASDPQKVWLDIMPLEEFNEKYVSV